METEIWKPVKGYEERYEVSTLGRIKAKMWKGSKKEKISEGHKSDRGYKTYALVGKNGKIYKTGIHRLVYCTFNGIDFKKYNPYKKTIICHKNDIKEDNRLNNLFLGNAKDNHDDMVMKGRRANFKGENNSFSKLKNEDVVKIKEHLKEGFLTHKEISVLFGVHRTVVSGIGRGTAWKHII